MKGSVFERENFSSSNFLKFWLLNFRGEETERERELMFENFWEKSERLILEKRYEREDRKWRGFEIFRAKLSFGLCWWSELQWLFFNRCQLSIGYEIPNKVLTW